MEEEKEQTRIQNVVTWEHWAQGQSALWSSINPGDISQPNGVTVRTLASRESIMLSILLLIKEGK